MMSFTDEDCLWEGNDWLYERQHGFRLGNSCESQINIVCQDIADSLNQAARQYPIIVDFSKAFVLVPHDRLLKKIVALGVHSRAFVRIREFLIGRSQS
jgi:hypothetical protein